MALYKYIYSEPKLNLINLWYLLLFIKRKRVVSVCKLPMSYGHRFLSCILLAIAGAPLRERLVLSRAYLTLRV
jgi:hypothetical protein